ncbi:MAG: hypothetical protein KAG20_06295 [Cocleimonas sp.]|nr:hypothetical protein [Cocleimonas sp.]
MRTILHIGQHKTGTTSLQHYLKNNREKLLKKGLYVPDNIIEITHPSHYILNVYALDSNRQSPMKEVLLKQKKSDYFDTLEKKLIISIGQQYKKAREYHCSDIIWTNEGLYLLNSIAEYKKLRLLFQNETDEIVSVCCFREKASFRRSYMAQLKKQGLSFSHIEDSYCYVEPTSWLFDYDRKKTLLNHTFEKNITLDYHQNDMVSIFMQAIGYDAVDIPIERLNVT